jgi:propanol-preferring alcohol dehydrogenase
MAKKMQAAFVEHFGKPLVFMEVDVPTPGPGQILVKTEACGVCPPTCTQRPAIGR